MSSRDKDAEILVLRHQLSVLQRQLGPDRVRFTPGDRALLAALLHRLPGDVLKRLHLVVRPDTVLRWHRDVVARRHARRSRPRHRGRPRTVRSIRVLVLRLVRENPGWGYRRVHGELLALGVKAAASTVWEILHDAGIDPAPERSSTTWADFLRSQAGALLACDFFETVTLVRRAAARARGDRAPACRAGPSTTRQPYGNLTRVPRTLHPLGRGGRPEEVAAAVS
jgi:transposase